MTWPLLPPMSHTTASRGASAQGYTVQLQSIAQHKHKWTALTAREHAFVGDTAYCDHRGAEPLRPSRDSASGGCRRETMTHLCLGLATGLTRTEVSVYGKRQETPRTSFAKYPKNLVWPPDALVNAHLSAAFECANSGSSSVSTRYAAAFIVSSALRQRQISTVSTAGEKSTYATPAMLANGSVERRSMLSRLFANTSGATIVYVRPGVTPREEGRHTFGVDVLGREEPHDARELVRRQARPRGKLADVQPRRCVAQEVGDACLRSDAEACAFFVLYNGASAGAPRGTIWHAHAHGSLRRAAGLLAKGERGQTKTCLQQVGAVQGGRLWRRAAHMRPRQFGWPGSGCEVSPREYRTVRAS